MIKKGIISSINGNKASVIFPDRDNLTTQDIPIICHPLNEIDVSVTEAVIGGGMPTTISGKLSGVIYQTFNINDVVLVAFWAENLNAGVILGRVDT